MLPFELVVLNSNNLFPWPDASAPGMAGSQQLRGNFAAALRLRLCCKQASAPLQAHQVPLQAGQRSTTSRPALHCKQASLAASRPALLVLSSFRAVSSPVWVKWFFLLALSSFAVCGGTNFKSFQHKQASAPLQAVQPHCKQASLSANRPAVLAPSSFRADSSLLWVKWFFLLVLSSFRAVSSPLWVKWFFFLPVSEQLSLPQKGF
jgi:hypothetical protein